MKQFLDNVRVCQTDDLSRVLIDLDLIKRNRLNGLIQRAILFAVLLTCFCPPISFSQINASEILSRVEKRFQEINDYTAEAMVSIEMERLRIPRRKMKIFFKQPDKFHLESEGFAIIPRAGLGFIPSQLQHDKYEPKIIKLDTFGVYPSYKLQLSVKDLSTSAPLPVQNFYMWVDKDNFVIRKIETATAQGRDITVSFDYGMVDKRYLMPSNIVVSLQNLFDDKNDIQDVPGRESRLRRLPREGTVTITFTKYSVNQNLQDSLFEKGKIAE
ncbi:MAG: hypothetical protein QME58_02190 [Bacteroidota bacterium]|nr:hypothetical protein [Bacteroidota bacterium]